MSIATKRMMQTSTIPLTFCTDKRVGPAREGRGISLGRGGERRPLTRRRSSIYICMCVYIFTYMYVYKYKHKYKYKYKLKNK